MPATEELDLIALICSRLCHDLASSIGAVNNGIELLAEETDPAMREEAIGLIAQSGNDAARRLAFFRLAFGASGGTGGPTAMTELTRIARNYFAGGRVAVTLPEGGADLPKALAKALMIGLMLAGQALPRGGEVRLTRSGDGWQISGSGALLRWPEGVAAALSDATDWPREPVAAMARYAQLLAGSEGQRVRVVSSETELRLDIAA